jgi:oxygen-independent coproporphyrinogen-3 oxidase
VIGLYLHVPYCTVRCSYCDFYLVTERDGDRAAFISALCAEIAAVPEPPRGAAADTVHFGGGTPSLLRASQVARVLAALGRVFRLAPDAEIALEANPEDLDAGRLRELAAAGVNRVSVGVQSLDDRLLSVLRRPHTADGAVRALEACRGSPIRSIGADLILGLPGEDTARALEALARLADLGLDHLSVYLLEVHPRTRLGREMALGRLEPAPDDATAALYETAADLLTGRGYEHYEISNFARPGHRSRHNLKYWTDQEYLGFGPAAHSYCGGQRWSNAPDLRGYLARAGVGAARIDDPQPRSGRGAEALFAGLRLAAGVDLEVLRRRYGAALPAPGDPRLDALRLAGLVEVQGPRLRLTRRGRLLSNEVFERLLPPPRPSGVQLM